MILIRAHHRVRHSFFPLLTVINLLILLLSAPFVSASEAPQTALSIVLPSAQPVKIITLDKYTLGGYYYPGQKVNGGVLILHDCDHDSRSYDELAQSLSTNGLNTLALDLRGYGSSSSEFFSHDKIKLQAKSITDYQSAQAALNSYWLTDILASYHYLLEKVNKNRGIAVISIGCSSSYAIALADKTHVNSVVMVTPKMSNADKELYKNIVDFPSYFINSSHHTETFQTSKELFEWNGAKTSKMQIFKGDNHDLDLFKKNKSIIYDITFWLKTNLQSPSTYK